MNRPLSGSLILVLAVVMLVISTASFANVQTIMAKDMLFKSIGGQMDTGEWLMPTNGYIGTFINLSAPETVTIRLNVSGHSANGIGPKIDLHIGGQKAQWQMGTSTAWTTYSASFDLPAGTHGVRIEYTNDYSATGNDRNLYIYAVTFSGSTVTLANDDASADNNALAAADTYILNNRRVAASVKITDSDGTPLPAGTNVQFKLKRHAFNFGTCVPGSTGDIYSMWAQANPTPGSDWDKYQKFVDSHFTMITPEAVGKWAYQEWVRDSVDMQYIDAYLDYAEKHNLRARMHAVCWDNEQSEPPWVNALEVTAAAGDPTAKQELRDEISERIQYYVVPRAGRYVEVDGINETVANPILTTIYGIPGIADIYNEIVAASNGRARVYVNELNVLVDSNYASWYVNHIKSIQKYGGTIQGIGCQTNVSSATPTAPKTIYRNLQNLDVFELPISTTEYRCASGGDAAKVLNNIMRLQFGNEMTNSFVMWGFWKNAIYSSGLAVLVNADWTLTTVGTEYERLMQQWNTNVTTTLGADGDTAFTGFYGDYDVIINGKTYPLNLAKGSNQFTVAIPTKVVVDSFSRSDSSSLGTTEDTGHRTWQKSTGESLATISLGQLQFATTSTTGGATVGGEFVPTDLDLRVTLSCGNSATAGIAYRQASSGSWTTGYAVNFTADGKTMKLLRNSTVINTYTLNPIIDWSVPHQVRVKVTGTKHEVWVGEQKVADITDTGITTPGYVCLTRSTGWVKFDNLAAAGDVPLTVNAVNGPREAKSLKDREMAASGDLFVTKKFDGYFYVENAGRSAGIKVVSQKAINVGDSIRFEGIIDTTKDGERQVNAWDVYPGTSAATLAPVTMANKSVGGGDEGLQKAVWSWTWVCYDDPNKAPEYLWIPAIGLNNTGALVRIFGQVTQVDPSGQYFYINDGSDLDDSTYTGSERNIGIRVAGDGRPYAGKNIAINGIVSCFKGTDGNLCRLIRITGSSDIQVL